jgi:hypothetical protein
MQRLTPAAHLAAELVDELSQIEEVYRAAIAKRDGRNYKLKESTREAIGRSIGEKSWEVARALGLHFSVKAVYELSMLGACESTASDVVHRTCGVRESIIQELSTRLFLPATTDMVEYLEIDQPYGSAAANAFSKCEEDISEAHKCFAFERYTASMFHIGRAMEIAVEETAKKMRLAVSRKDWQHYLNAMNLKVARMPFNTAAQKKKRLPYAEAAGHFFNFKEAWRNPTFHAKKTYTRDEAHQVIKSAGAFLSYVARTIFKVKCP